MRIHIQKRKDSKQIITNEEKHTKKSLFLFLETTNTVEPVYSGHLRFLEKVRYIEVFNISTFFKYSSYCRKATMLTKMYGIHLLVKIR